MDAVTKSVREQYERFPYPAGAPALRVASDVRMLLSFGALDRPHGQGLQALDAGCGRGVGVIGQATLQPDVQFLGIDLSRTALSEAAREAERRGLANVRFQEVDLMTLAGLEPPQLGFDAIFSSGVLHHLADPLTGLEKLASVLAPHGVISFMVYGRRGREPLQRVVRALERLAPRSLPLDERLAIARVLLEACPGEPLGAGPWKDAAALPDVEIVDRYLNAHEESYDVAGLMPLIEAAGLRFLRWSQPGEWTLDGTKLASLAARLSPLERWQVIEEVTWRPRLECSLCHAANGPRPRLSRSDLSGAALCVNPEVTFRIEKRNLHGAQRTERIAWRLRADEPVEVQKGALAQALVILADQTTAFRGSDLVGALSERGTPVDAALSVVEELVASEILYRPHEGDL